MDKRNRTRIAIFFSLFLATVIITAFVIDIPILTTATPTTNQKIVDYTYSPLNITENQKVVCVVFDDGWQSQWTYAVPVLNQYGFKATFAIITSYANGNYPNYMSWSEIVTLANNGEDIASHTYSHKPLATLDNASIIYQLSQSKQDLNSHGISAPVFVYPSGSGSGNATVENFVQQYYIVGRGITAGPIDLTQPFDRFAFQANQILNSTTFSEFTNIVNNASGSNIIILYYHRFADDPVVSTETTPQMFASEMQYLHDNDFTVMTMKQLLLKQVTAN